MKHLTCHRLGCEEQAKKGVRDRSGQVLIFCIDCFESLVKGDVIDRYTGEVLTT
jgi:hypothetical protein